MRYHRNRDIDTVIRKAIEQGWRHELLPSGHHRVLPANRNEAPVVIGGSPSDHRALANFKSALRRKGVEV